METNAAFLAYEGGDMSASFTVDAAVKAYMKEHNETDYSAAYSARSKEAKATAAWDKRDFTRMTRSYAAAHRISGNEAALAVAESNPRMRRIYEQDPMAASETAGIAEPRPTGDVTIKPWTPPVHESLAINQIANLIFNLPRDPSGFISLGQAAEALRPYPDILQRASADKVDFYTRSAIGIAGLPGATSKNYPAGFEMAKQRFPSLFALYSAGKLTSQSLRELLPQILITD